MLSVAASLSLVSRTWETPSNDSLSESPELVRVVVVGEGLLLGAGGEGLVGIAGLGLVLGLEVTALGAA